MRLRLISIGTLLGVFSAVANDAALKFTGSGIKLADNPIPDKSLPLNDLDTQISTFVTTAVENAATAWDFVLNQSASPSFYGEPEEKPKDDDRANPGETEIVGGVDVGVLEGWIKDLGEIIKSIETKLAEHFGEDKAGVRSFVYPPLTGVPAEDLVSLAEYLYSLTQYSVEILEKYCSR